jgi:regulator of replication initiation timing
MTTETDTKIVKTVLEPVESLAVDTQDMVPGDSEALELAEQELEATKADIAAVDAENDRLALENRKIESLLVYLFDRMTDEGVAMDFEKEGAIADLVHTAKTRPSRPTFTRK